MDEKKWKLDADILFLVEAKSTDNIIYWRAFLTKNKDKIASLKPLKSHS